MRRDEFISTIEVERFECHKNISPGDGLFVPCMKTNAFILTVDSRRKRILWGGETCRHYVGKVGTQISPAKAILIFKERIKLEEGKIKEAAANIKKAKQAIKFAKRLAEEY